MSDLNPNTPASSNASSELSELKNACAELESQSFTLRVILLLVVGALTVFLWREASYHKFEASQMQPQVMQASQLAEALKKQDSTFDKQMQILRGVATRLGEYGKVHPDYAQILAKYGVVVTAPAPATTPTRPTGTLAPVKK